MLPNLPRLALLVPMLSHLVQEMPVRKVGQDSFYFLVLNRSGLYFLFSAADLSFSTVTSAACLGTWFSLQPVELEQTSGLPSFRGLCDVQPRLLLVA